MKFEDAKAGVPALWSSVEPEVSRAALLTDAASVFVGGLYERFKESTVLARLFGIVPFSGLGLTERSFVRHFIALAGGEGELREQTPVLTLLGTRGVMPEWNDRLSSRGHLAIPLLSEAFVGEIPMIARLLAEVGITPFAPPRPRSQYVTRQSRSPSGLFFVGDARMTTDERGRLIIPATDFVEQHRVKSVFGFGAPYPTGRMFLTVIVFCRDTILRADAAAFVPLVDLFAQRTEALVERDAIVQAPVAAPLL